MEDIVSLQNQIEAAVRANDALTAKAKVESRAFTPAEQAAFDKNAADIKAFKDRIAYAQGVAPKTDVEEQIDALVIANEALTLKRETEHRAFTPDEQAEFDKNAANIKAFKASVAYPRGVGPWPDREAQIDAAVKANDALTAKAKGESRAFTPAEQAAFDKNAADIEALKARVAYEPGFKREF